MPRGTTTEAAPQSCRYSGAYLDPTGLYKMGARYYDPQLGRFTQPDPSGEETKSGGAGAVTKSLKAARTGA
ncbi:RHS repeat-associated core domain-containing protein [Streptomyces sp. NPDC006335]|uniref:RHS repeat-associated core domain-containing protein n=1 Tax=Streptomyces sp. NPDC006335 TaxID=3156895 RepID=UPI0033AA4B4B